MFKRNVCLVLGIALLTLFVLEKSAVYAEELPWCPLPCINIIKTGPKYASPGDTITFDFFLENCGNVKLGTGAWVSDFLFGPNKVWTGCLMPGEMVVMSKDYTVTEEDCGLLVNVAKAAGMPEDSTIRVYDESAWTVIVECSPGTGSPGYWKNHPEDWPTDVIRAQCCSRKASVSKMKALEIMDMSGAGDKCFTMFRALVAAKLNVMIGNADYCVDKTIQNAECWMIQNCAGFSEDGMITVDGSSDAWMKGEPMYMMLDSYNNGELCAPHRDD